MKTFATAVRAEPTAPRPCALCGAERFGPLWRLEGFSFVRCGSCGLIQQNPQPAREAVLARYGSEYLEYETERQFEYRDLELLALEDLGFEEAAAGLVVRARKERRAVRFLDVGCATGALLEHFRSRGWDCQGIEVSAEEAAWGRKHWGLDILSTTLEDAGLAAASREVVHASHLVEHLNDPRSFLAECRRVLAPEGLLVLATPNADGFQARLLRARWRSAIYDHLYLFSRRTLSALLADCGFDILRSITWGGWAAGLRPAFLKRPLDRAAKRFGFGDVMAYIARRRPD
jgi:2-polyprenyl-3-methyl-5-hydroxy-6-metoxy-1,4-benzoquinol methylase